MEHFMIDHRFHETVDIGLRTRNQSFIRHFDNVFVIDQSFYEIEAFPYQEVQDLKYQDPLDNTLKRN